MSLLLSALLGQVEREKGPKERSGGEMQDKKVYLNKLMKGEERRERAGECRGSARGGGNLKSWTTAQYDIGTFPTSLNCLLILPCAFSLVVRNK